MPNGKKRKRHKMATQSAKTLKKNRHKKGSHYHILDMNYETLHNVSAFQQANLF